MYRLYATIFALLLLAVPRASLAQVSNQKLAEINRVAMEAYNNLDIETARSTLEDAIRNAERSGTHGAALARTYANLGVVVVGGLGDSSAGVDAFSHALKEDSNVEPDPIVATPEIMVAFTTAKKKTGGGSRASSSPSASRSSTKSGPVEGNLSHEPAPEQLSQTAVPVFVGKGGVSASKVRIFYQSLGMSKPKSAEMKQTEDGWAYLIPCTDVFEPTVEYFIVAEDNDGDQVGNAGTPERPIAVPIVSTRTQEAPSLPGQEPPTQCGATGTVEECPPGLPGCSTGTAQLGDTCRSNSDCGSGLRCVDDFCAMSDGDEPRASSDKSGAPKWFVDVGLGAGFTFVKSGQSADRPAPTGLVNDVAAKTGADLAMGKALLAAGGYDCNYDLKTQPSGLQGVVASNCKVALKSGGIAPALMLNIAIGRFLTPRIAVALWGRFQLAPGQGPLAGMAIGARGEYLLTKPQVKGFHSGVLLGAGLGSIQAHASGSAKGTPYSTSAVTNAVGAVFSLGLRAGYRFNKYIGLLLTPAVTIGVPRVMTSIDVSGGLVGSL